MRTPYDRLEAFEQKHGEYTVLLDNYVEAATRQDQIERLAGIDEAARYVTSRARAQLQRHSELVWACMGYDQGRKHAKREAMPCASCGATRDADVHLREHTFVYPTSDAAPASAEGPSVTTSVEEYIRLVNWSDNVDDETKALVAVTLRAFASWLRSRG